MESGMSMDFSQPIGTMPSKFKRILILGKL